MSAGARPAPCWRPAAPWVPWRAVGRGTRYAVWDGWASCSVTSTRCDDLLPYVASSADTGKDATSDARQRRATLPIIVAWRGLDAPGRERLSELMLRADLPETERHAGLAELLTACGALTQSRRMVVAGGRQALDEIDQLPAGAARQVFRDLVEYLAGIAEPAWAGTVVPAA